ncbi:MAG: rhomboid family intramembrane serine protease [Rhizobiaceae bacterium]|jgi:membrane associated rhomboid family serine protease|nr:rhomboid family intramembrane serine protease [Rhizobiaceae bacterium]
MFIPLHDANSLKRIRLQYVTIALIAANCIVFALQATQTADMMQAAVIAFGFTPGLFTDALVAPAGLYVAPDSLTLVSYAFLHGDIFHLGGNMLFLWVFGDNVEDAMGHFRFLIFYLLCAAAAALFHGAMDLGSDIPLIGASGAVAGVLAAYLVLHPKVKIWVLAFARIPIRLPAWIVLLLWIAFQFVMLFAMPEDAISWAAHVGGIIAGIVLVFLFKRRGVPLFDRQIVTPAAVEIRHPREAGTSVPVTKWGR